MCLSHMASRFGVEGCKPLLAEFCEVVESTVGMWLLKGTLPTGEGLIKQRVFLDLAGYRVNELQELPRKSRQLCQVIGFGMMTADEVKTELGYKNVQDLYRVLLRGQSMLPDKQHKMDQLLERSADELKRHRARWQAKIEDTLDIDLSAPQVQTAGEQPVPAFSGHPHEPEIVDSLITALSLVLDNGNQEGWRSHAPMPLSERRSKAIRDYVGDDKLRRLEAQLAMLG
jgi:hypothetical protein